MTRLLGIALLVGAALARAGPAGETASTGDPPALTPLLRQIRALDQRYVGPPSDVPHTWTAPRAACLTESGGAEQETCWIDALLRSDRVRAVDNQAPVEMSTVSFVMAQGKGTCSAIVATILAVTDSPSPPFDALVLRDHVVLASNASEGRYYEVLDRGRVLSVSELKSASARGAAPPIRVRGSEFLPFYLDNLAARLALEGRTDSAEQAIQRALELAPEAARIRYNYGTFLLGQERYTDALAELDQAIRLGWKDANALTNRGVALWKLDRVAEARGAFEAALELDPHHRAAAANLAALP